MSDIRRRPTQLVRWRYRCTECGTEFEDLEVDEIDSHERTLLSARTPSGELAVLDWDEEPEWDRQTDALMAALIAAVRAGDLGPYSKTAGPPFLLSRFLDPAPSGERYQVERRPPCPNGHGFEPVAEMAPTQPRENRTLPLPLLRHSEWDALGDDGRREATAQAIAELRSALPELRRRSFELADRSEAWRRRKLQSTPLS